MLRFYFLLQQLNATPVWGGGRARGEVLGSQASHHCPDGNITITHPASQVPRLTHFLPGHLFPPQGVAQGSLKACTMDTGTSVTYTVSRKHYQTNNSHHGLGVVFFNPHACLKRPKILSPPSRTEHTPNNVGFR